MKTKVSEITSLQLDWIVTDLEGVKTYGIKDWLEQRPYTVGNRWSTDWAQSGPIIERERIALTAYLRADLVTHWRAVAFTSGTVPMYGETPLIAAMRCYVASKLGDEVEVPNELV
jgi:hypothetical protein